MSVGRRAWPEGPHRGPSLRGARPAKRVFLWLHLALDPSKERWKTTRHGRQTRAEEGITDPRQWLDAGGRGWKMEGSRTPVRPMPTVPIPGDPDFAGKSNDEIRCVGLHRATASRGG